MSHIPKDAHGRIKCEICGGSGYKFLRGQGGQERCSSCQGDGVSRKPAATKPEKATIEDLDLP
jgi:DnaJ-class molecular chaperone